MFQVKHGGKLCSHVFCVRKAFFYFRSLIFGYKILVKITILLRCHRKNKISVLGAKVVSMKKFEPNSFLAAIQKYRVTVLPLVPPIILFLCKSPLVKEYDLSSVREIFSGAAPLGKEQAEEVTSKLGIKCLRQGM